MRSGTVPHTLAVGLGAACQVAAQEMEVSLQQGLLGSLSIRAEFPPSMMVNTSPGSPGNWLMG